MNKAAVPLHLLRELSGRWLPTMPVIVSTGMVILSLLGRPLLAAEQNDELGDQTARVEFTLEVAKELRGLKTIRALQAALGATGAVDPAKAPAYCRYRWKGAHGIGEMVAFAYDNGDFRATIYTDDQHEITLNSFGAFACSACSPPVNACGNRPSWIPHDLHWDNWDCAHPLDR